MIDLAHLPRCVELAQLALDNGNPPFGSLLIGPDGAVLAEDYNQISGGDRTRHPELGLAQWACLHLTPCQRRKSTVYTSGEHCPMCAAAHGWAGLGRIVYATSSAQLDSWMHQWGIRPSNVRALPIQDILVGVPVDGPEPALAETIRAMHRQFHHAQA